MSTSIKGWCVRPFLYTRCGIRVISRQAVKHGGRCVCVCVESGARGRAKASVFLKLSRAALRVGEEANQFSIVP